MKIRIVRIIVAGLAAEILAILALVLIILIFGPSDPEQVQAYAERMGLGVGPIAGFLFCLLGGWWVARKLPEAQLLNGFVLGLFVAGIDVTILLATGGVEFHPVFVVSNIGRVVAGILGGRLAARGARGMSLPRT